MGTTASRSTVGGASVHQSGRWRSPRSVRTDTERMDSPEVDCERHNSKWRSLVSPRRKHRPAFGDNPDEHGSPIISTPGASADREVGTPPSPGDAGGDKKHCTGGDAPVLSPKAAAILAATEAAIREEENAAKELDAVTASLPDRPEEPRENGAGAAARKRRQARLAAAAGQAPGGNGAGGEGGDFGLSASWMIDRNAITIGKTIGHSSFGSVCEGRLNGTKVAVKTIKRMGKGGNEDDAMIAKESEFNCRLRHPNIILFMGIALTPNEVCIVTELMSRGNVRDLLVPAPGGRTVKLDLGLRLQWAVDTAQGMAYLHTLSPPMIHRDLKTTNLLVDRGMNVKICDFGMSRIQAEDKIMTAVGTVQFAAPEVLKHERYSEKVDLFSFGTVMWELYTRQAVFDKLPQLSVYQAVISGNMPGVDNDCDPTYKQVMQKCWSLKPSDRPSFQEVIEQLSELADAYEAL